MSTSSPLAAKTNEIAALNAALADIPGASAVWWSYTVSHQTFELVVGEPNGHRNVVIALSACDEVSGPTRWSEQNLQVRFTLSSEAWLFEVVDRSASFVARSRMLAWRKDFDVLENHSPVWGGRTDSDDQILGPTSRDA
ncbi:MAG: hypothetical protein K8R60_07405 [Burkholderiales bacterium]|nr:hypothetical protein [Burkholderiales bacterium]